MDQHLSTLEMSSTPNGYQSMNLYEPSLRECKVTLQPLTMRLFNSHGVYFPSKLKPKKVVSYEEFLECYADHSIEMRVCFDEKLSLETMLQKSELVTAYGVGRDGWCIATFHIVENGP